MRDIIPPELLNKDEILRINTILEILKDYDNHIILDVGTGDGRIALEKAMDGCRVIGIDNSTNQLAEAERYKAKYEYEHPPVFLNMSATAIEYPDNYFDLVMASEMLEHLTDADLLRVTQEMKRVCKPDGIILVTVPWKNCILGSPECPHLQSLDYGDLAVYFNITDTFDIKLHDDPGKWIGILAINVPRISIVIPSYNNGRFIGEAIESVQGQVNFQDYELIIVEDGSTDDSLSIIQQYDNIKLIIHNGNKGVSQAWSTGLAQARGEYCMILSSDDRFAPDAFVHMYNAITSDPDIVLVHGQVINISEDGESLNHIPWTPPEHDYDLLMRENYIGHAVLVDSRLKTEKTVLGETILTAEPDEWGCCDYGMWLKIADYAHRAGKRFKRLEHVLYYYRNHPKATRNTKERKERMPGFEDIVHKKAKKRRNKKVK